MPTSWYNETYTTYDQQSTLQKSMEMLNAFNVMLVDFQKYIQNLMWKEVMARKSTIILAKN